MRIKTSTAFFPDEERFAFDFQAYRHKSCIFLAF
jgi:hypothetical protein